MVLVNVPMCYYKELDNHLTNYVEIICPVQLPNKSSSKKTLCFSSKVKKKVSLLILTVFYENEVSCLVSLTVTSYFQQKIQADKWPE